MIRLLKKMSKKEYILIGICILFIIFQVWLDLTSPEYMSNITKLVSMPGSAIRDIYKQGFWMLLCAIGSLLAAIIIGYLSSFISSSLARKLRSKLFNKVGNFGMEEVNHFSVSSLVNRTTNDIMNIERFVSMGLHILVKAPILSIWAISKILGKSQQWSNLTFISVAITVGYVIVVMFLVFPKFRVVQKQIDEMNGVARENLKGIRVVRAFNASEYQEAKFQKANQILTNTQTFTQTALSTLNPLMYIIMYLLTLAIYFVGAYLIGEAGAVDRLELFSDMVVFSTYAMQILMSFIMLILVFVLYPRVSISAKRILEVLEKDISIQDGKQSSKNTSQKGKIDFVDVSFNFPGGKNFVLEHINFSIEPGETVAFVGATGSGKSSLVNLIPRFFDATKGNIFVDGINVRDYSLASLRRKIGYVSQKPLMFQGTIASNVTYGASKMNKSQERLTKAIEVAQAKEFVLELEGSYDAKVAQGGTNLSGGQKQRLSIARAIYRTPEIYIFDDSFSALDYKTDLALRSKLKKYTKDATTLIVSGRIGTIRNADKIIVLDEGKCVGIGTHQELIKTCKIYKEIALSQITEGEL